jgi:hypothetical protein
MWSNIYDDISGNRRDYASYFQFGTKRVYFSIRMERLSRKIFLPLYLVTAMFLTGTAVWADSAPGSADNSASAPGAYSLLPHETDSLTPPPALPKMAPELALQTYVDRQERQASLPPEYLADVTIEAVLPETAQRGQFELQRHFIAPKTLLFKPLRFVGDNFVKSNIITRVLQSEVDHVAKGDNTQTAISDTNYKFSYKGMESLEGNPVHVFHVKPRKKRTGLFKGKIYVDAFSGELRRAEGTVVKSPSFFIKKIEFTQDYGAFEGYTLPVRMHSEAKTRLVGRAVVDIVTKDYEFSAPHTESAGATFGSSSQNPASSQ